jgi:hypothetical protein
MSNVRVFVSFDIEHDGDLCDLLLEESRRDGSGFEVAGRTETAPDPGGDKVRRRIAAADEVIVVCGEHTDESPRSQHELKIAQEEEKPYFLLWGRRESMCKRPESAKASDAMYSWTREILLAQISETIRNATPRVIPENLKRAVPRRAQVAATE